MNKLLLFIVPILLLSSCAVSEKNFPREDKPWEGWAGLPDKPGKQPFDYFYVKSSARASQKAIEKQSLLMLRDTCKDAASTVGKAELFAKILNDSTEQCGSECEGSKAEQTKKIQPLLTEIKVKECKPTAAIETFEGSEWRECECIVYANVPGGKSVLVRTLKD